MYKEHCQNVETLIEKDKSVYYRNVTSESKGNQNINIEIGDSKVAPYLFAKSLGVTFDNCMMMDKNVRNCCRSIQFHIRNIGKLRHLLSQDNAAQLVHSIITSRLAYCNSLLYGLLDTLTARL